MNFLKLGKSLIFYLIDYSSIFFNYLYSRFKVLFVSSIFKLFNLPTMFPIIIKFGVWYLFSFNFDFMSLIACERSSTLLLSWPRYAFLKTSYSMYRKFSMYFALYSLSKILSWINDTFELLIDFFSINVMTSWERWRFFRINWTNFFYLSSPNLEVRPFCNIPNTLNITSTAISDYPFSLIISNIFFVAIWINLF